MRRTGGYNTLYSLTPTGSAIRGAVEALGQWGLSLGPMGPAALVSTPRSLAMPLQSVLGVAGAAHGDLRDLVIELVVDDEPIEIVLGPSVTATARAAVEPASRATSTIEDLSAFMMGGLLTDTTIQHLDGDAAATRVLVELFAAAAAMAAA